MRKATRERSFVTSAVVGICVASLAAASAAAASSTRTTLLAQYFAPLAEGRDLPTCGTTGRVKADCHIHDRITYLSVLEGDAKKFAHAGMEYEEWRRIYMAR